MNVFGKEVPCGCEERKEIMFDTGGFGITEGAILGIAVVLLFAAWRLT